MNVVPVEEKVRVSAWAKVADSSVLSSPAQKIRPQAMGVFGMSLASHNVLLKVLKGTYLNRSLSAETILC